METLTRILELKTQKRSDKYIARELDIDLPELKGILKSKDYRRLMAKESICSIYDLVPKAAAYLGDIMEDEETPAREKLKAIQMILDISNVKEQEEQQSTVKVEVEYV